MFFFRLPLLGKGGDKMLKPLQIEYMGYAAATTGGVSFMVKMEVPEGRFPDIKNGAVVLNIVAPLKRKSLTYRVVSRMVDGSGVTHYSEQVKLTREERTVIDQWTKENGIRKQADEIAAKFESARQYYFDVCEELNQVYYKKKQPTNLDELISQNKEIAELQKKAEKANAEMESLRDIKLV